MNTYYTTFSPKSILHDHYARIYAEDLITASRVANLIFKRVSMTYTEEKFKLTKKTKFAAEIYAEDFVLP